LGGSGGSTFLQVLRVSQWNNNERNKSNKTAKGKTFHLLRLRQSILPHMGMRCECALMQSWAINFYI